MTISFITPGLLLGLLALPVIFWLLRALPPTATRIPFGATIFLESLTASRETPARTPWWILLLRLSALGLVIIGLAGPVRSSHTEGTGDGPLLIIIDDTWAAASSWQERLDAVRSLSAEPGAEERIARYITPDPSNTLSAQMPLKRAITEISSLQPRAQAAHRPSITSALDDETLQDTDIFWLSDGTIGRTGGDRDFLQWLKRASSVTVYRQGGNAIYGIIDARPTAQSLDVSIRRIGRRRTEGVIHAYSDDGRLLASEAFTFDPDANDFTVSIDAPLEIRNDIASLRLGGARSAGATWLLNAGDKRVRAGLVTNSEATLLDSGFYIRQALSPVADIVTGDIDTLISPALSLIVLDDVGAMRQEADQSLADWIAQGGILLRFAGPNTATSETIQDGVVAATFPVPLRGTDRSFGGAISWASAQHLQRFSADSPLASIPFTDEIEVRRQVLARSGTTMQYDIWARLSDGTPLISARKIEQGTVIMIHVTASPTWSDLPVSPVFADIISVIAGLAAGLPAEIPDQPLLLDRQLNGFGELITPDTDDIRHTPEEIRGGDAVPGHYGPPETALAANSWTGGSPRLDPLSSSLLPQGTQFRGPEMALSQDFGPLLLACGIALLALDALLLFLTSRMSRAVLALLFTLPLASWPTEGHAQTASFRPQLSQQASDASLRVHFAYVVTGDRTVDGISRAGLFGLTRECIRRTSLEPAPPMGVDIERDDLSVYPLIYWPIVANAPPPSAGALSRLERFMAGGGLLVVDLRDGERRNAGIETSEQRTASRFLRRMNIRPLEPVAEGHILTRSFYHLKTLPGRNSEGSVWVDAQTALQETTDAVPSIIIGSRDWAAAWAVDEGGTPLRPAGSGGEYGRELAYRTGINMAMVALTGNYKGDQAGVQDLLDQLESRSTLP